ncbi:MAG TPA: HD domain-containing protein [Chitinophagaceae bacterium]
MDILEQVKQFAEKAHGDQQRKFEPEPYSVHLVRVMNLTKEYVHEIPVLAAALLHDVLEDTPVSSGQINDFLIPLMGEKDTRRTLKLVTELTDVYVKDNYPQWNRRKRKQKEAERLSRVSSAGQTIKYADIIDNSTTIAKAEDDFAKVYLMECRALLKEMKNGDPQLYKRAINTVDHCMEKYLSLKNR